MKTKSLIRFAGCSRRESLFVGMGAFAAALFGPGLILRAASAAKATDSIPVDVPSGPLVLPALPYAFDALEPAIDAETMRIHHDKHHKAYVDNANRILAGLPDLAKLPPDEILLNLDKAPENVREGLINNVGGHINHSLFWLMMTPGGGGEPKGAVGEAITRDFGSFEAFKTRFSDAALKRFGSGWAWLARDKDGKLSIVSTPNQNPPLLDGLKPLLGLDVWEHAYYLKYQNRRADYVREWWSTVNWDFVNSQLAG